MAPTVRWRRTRRWWHWRYNRGSGDGVYINGGRSGQPGDKADADAVTCNQDVDEEEDEVVNTEEQALSRGQGKQTEPEAVVSKHEVERAVRVVEVAMSHALDRRGSVRQQVPPQVAGSQPLCRCLGATLGWWSRASW